VHGEVYRNPIDIGSESKFVFPLAFENRVCDEPILDMLNGSGIIGHLRARRRLQGR
jgi:hypothetical protein